MFWNRVLLNCVFALSAFAFVMYAMFKMEKRKTIDLSFAVDSITAVNDSQRVVMIGENQIAIRRAIQAELEKDSLSRLLNTQKRANFVLSGQLTKFADSLRVLAATPFDTTCVENCVIDFTFNQYTEPYTLKADVSVWYLQNQAELRYSVETDRIPLRVSLECGEPMNGVRSATVAIKAPRYFNLSLDTLQQSRHICNPSVGKQRSSTLNNALWFTGGAATLYLAARTANGLFKKR